MPQPKTAAKTAVKLAPTGLPVVRRPDGVWVCPHDHANQAGLDRCGRCGGPMTGGRVECLETER